MLFGFLHKKKYFTLPQNFGLAFTTLFTQLSSLPQKNYTVSSFLNTQL